MKLQAPPVKVCALAHNIPVYQPVKLRDGAALALIQELAPELIVVAAYGLSLIHISAGRRWPSSVSLPAATTAPNAAEAAAN